MTVRARIAIALMLTLAGTASAAAATKFDLTTASVAQINAAFDSGALTSEKLVQLYLKRIEAYDQRGPKLNAVLVLNPAALETARALDKERREKGARSPLHGIPVLVKDVFDTSDLPTTGGYLPLKGVKPAQDATVVRKLREAGAIILAKVNQSDWYTTPDIIAISSLAGSVHNPYALDRIPGWSSSGTAAGLAAHFGTVGLGSETGYSIRTPASDTNLYGLATTSGLISRAGQMWSYITGERGGPMARSVYDLVVTLDVIAGFDSADLWTAQSLGKMPLKSYASFIDANGLRGARVGVLKEAWDFHKPHVDPKIVELARIAIKVFSDQGAQVFDPVSLNLDLVNYLEANPLSSRFERIAAINQYLARQGPAYPFKTASQLLLGHPGITPRPTDLAVLENPIDLDRDPAYRAVLQGRAALREAVVALLDRYQLDALIYPHKLSGPLKIGPKDDPERKYVGNQLSPTTGLPAFIVPAGITSDGLPVGLEILGRAWSEPTLIKLASGFEAATRNRQLPATTPPLPGESLSY